MTNGRPRATSRDDIAEAACELFLEQGYTGTSVSDIARRAGVGRSSFFNYFDSKAAIVWSGFDRAAADFRRALSDRAGSDSLAAALQDLADSLTPDALTLVLAHQTPMEIAPELQSEAASRAAELGRTIADHLAHDDTPALSARIIGAAYGEAILVGIEEWARSTGTRTTLPESVRAAVETVPRLLAAAGT